MKSTDGIRSFDSTANQVAFPLGGVGTGNVSLGAHGDLRDWEIFHGPAKGNFLPNTFFAIRAKSANTEPVTRVLEGPIPPPHALSHGYHPVTSGGLPRFAKSTLHGEYPIVTVDLEDDELPIRVQLEAYTPLIPLNPEDSGIPVAILTYAVSNTTDDTLDVTLVGSMVNPIGGIKLNRFSQVEPTPHGVPVNDFRDTDGLRGITFDTSELATDHIDYGNIALVTDHDDVSYKRAWLRGAWFDNLREFWDDLVEDGQLTDLDYDEPPKDNKPDTASLALRDTLQAGETKSFRFILTWYIPNHVNSWDSDEQYKGSDNPGPTIRKHYATRFDDAWDVARYTFAEFERLEAGTRNFHEAFFSSTLSPVMLDAISANIVPIRSTTCFWLEDGRFYGWEGCFDDQGCCPGSCTHVWSYAHTAAFLFPSLERSMRETEFEVETLEDGYMTFRTFKTFGGEFVWHWGDQRPEAAVDGQMGCILRAYREWQLSGDTDWLRRLWSAIKKSIAFASMQWDSDKDHVLDGRQHNTYDIEFYGPNPLSSIYYLAALRAVEEMAKVLDEPQIAENCRTAFEMGSRNLDEMLWNGEFYIQKLDDVDAYLYQHGIGCLSDQMLGQLHARVLGLGDLLPADHIRSTVKSIYDYNFRTNFKNHLNCQRTYVLNDESGLLLCSWPHGGSPKYPIVYSDEVWTGIEYQVAAHLIYEGYVDEAHDIVKAVRDRHEGYRRNPWNEVECGHHYARSMSSWALLTAASGVTVNMSKNEIHFAPKMETSNDQDHFQTFWSTGTGWGTFAQTKSGNGWDYEFVVLGGSVDKLTVYANGQTIQ